KVEIDSASLRLLDKLLVGQHGVAVESERRNLGRAAMRELLVCLGKRRSLDVTLNPFEERGPVGSDIVAALVLPPGELAADELSDRRHRIGKVVARCAQVL